MIRLFANHPTAANLLSFLFIVAGILSLSGIRRETFPDFSKNEIEVRIVYPGASAEEIEEAICLRVEDQLDGIPAVEEIRSDAREGVGVVTIQMEEGGDFQTFRDDVESEIGAIEDLPDDAEDPVITELGTEDLVLSLLVSGAMEPPDLKSYCEGMKSRLRQLPGVSLVEITGFSDHQLRIELSQAALKSYGLSVAAVAERVERQSVDLPSGTLETGEREILVRFVERRRTPAELEDLIVLADAGGAEVRLGQLGRVIDLFDDPEDKIETSRGRAAIIQIKKTKTQDTITIADTVKDFLRCESEQLPPAVVIDITQDSSVLVRERLDMLITNGWQGLLLVFVTMWVFFSFRLSIWVAFGLPISFLGAFFLLPPLGLTINMMTMVGLLLALGLLMDDAIVIAENIATHLKRGESPIRAAVDGTGEVFLGVLSSFLTTCCVLGPLAMIEGDIGKVLKVIPVILVVVLAVSLVEAFFILPAHLAHSLHGVDPKNAGRIRRRIDRGVDTLKEGFGRIVDGALRWRYLSVGAAIGLFLISVGILAGGVVKFQALPDLDGDVVQARLLLPPGTPLSRTEATVDRLLLSLEEVNEAFRDRQPQRADLVQSVNVQFSKNSDAFESGAHVATVAVDLLSSEFRNARVDEILQEWRERTGSLPDVVSLVFGEPAFGPAGRAIEIRFQGEDLEALDDAADQALVWFRQFHGVLDLADDLRRGKQEIRLRLRPGALALGLDAATAARQLRASLQGLSVDKIQVGPESYEIEVRLDPTDRNSEADLEDFSFSVNGAQVPFSVAVEARFERGWSRIARVDGKRTVTLRGDVDSRVVNSAALIRLFERDYLPKFAAEYPDLSVSLEGEAKESKKTQGSMVRALLIGLIGVFVLLSFQFRSYLEPLVVMISIPFAFIGVIWGHLLMGADLTMPSLLGFLSLAGVVVNDSILLVTFLKMQLRDGGDIEVAARHACRQRFRAVLLTSLTTIAGLIPLLLETSLQAQLLIPLAISIVFGMAASTVLVLILVPLLYTILGDFGLVRIHPPARKPSATAR